MTKIVYNGCFGGFGLSKLAQREYAKRKGFEVYFYRQTAYKHDGGRDEYTRVDVGEAESVFGCTLKVDAGAKTKKLPDRDDAWFWDREIPRNDPDLVAVVEALGEKASGQCAKLKIAEVPKGTPYRIDEYDGNESVMTQDTYDWKVA